MVDLPYNMPLLDLIKLAQGVQYVPPSNRQNVEEYTEDEVFDATLSRILHDPTIVYGMIVCCKKYQPVKMLLKQALQDYIAKFSNSSQ